MVVSLYEIPEEKDHSKFDGVRFIWYPTGGGGEYLRRMALFSSTLREGSIPARRPRETHYYPFENFLKLDNIVLSTDRFCQIPEGKFEKQGIVSKEVALEYLQEMRDGQLEISKKGNETESLIAKRVAYHLVKLHDILKTDDTPLSLSRTLQVFPYKIAEPVTDLYLAIPYSKATRELRVENAETWRVIVPNNYSEQMVGQQIQWQYQRLGRELGELLVVAIPQASGSRKIPRNRTMKLEFGVL